MIFFPLFIVVCVCRDGWVDGIGGGGIMKVSLFFPFNFFLPFSFCALSCRYVEPTLLASVCEPDDISVSLVLSQD